MARNDDVHARLRAAILRGVYAPRQRLVEAELAEEYGASRFTLRNALILLASDGLVELQPNRGARVREISLAEALEITELRQQVEGILAARAAEKVTEEQSAFLLDLDERMRTAVATGDFLTYAGLNGTLHGTIRDIADHATARRVLDQLHGQLVHHQFQLALVPGRPHISLPEHRAIIDAIRSRDPERARAAMSAHVGSVAQTLTALAEQRADGEPSVHGRFSVAHNSTPGAAVDSAD